MADSNSGVLSTGVLRWVIVMFMSNVVSYESQLVALSYNFLFNQPWKNIYLLLRNYPQWCMCKMPAPKALSEQPLYAYTVGDRPLTLACSKFPLNNTVSECSRRAALAVDTSSERTNREFILTSLKDIWTHDRTIFVRFDSSYCLKC